MSAKMECPICKGIGRVPHVKRKTINPEGVTIDDPADLQIEEVCWTCTGTGRVSYVDPEREK